MEILTLKSFVFYSPHFFLFLSLSPNLFILPDDSIFIFLILNFLLSSSSHIFNCFLEIFSWLFPMWIVLKLSSLSVLPLLQKGSFKLRTSESSLTPLVHPPYPICHQNPIALSFIKYLKSSFHFYSNIQYWKVTITNTLYNILNSMCRHCSKCFNKLLSPFYRLTCEAKEASVTYSRS